MKTPQILPNWKRSCLAPLNEKSTKSFLRTLQILPNWTKAFLLWRERGKKKKNCLQINIGNQMKSISGKLILLFFYIWGLIIFRQIGMFTWDQLDGPIANYLNLILPNHLENLLFKYKKRRPLNCRNKIAIEKKGKFCC